MTYLQYEHKKIPLELVFSLTEEEIKKLAETYETTKTITARSCSKFRVNTEFQNFHAGKTIYICLRSFPRTPLFSATISSVIGVGKKQYRQTTMRSGDFTFLVKKINKLFTGEFERKRCSRNKCRDYVPNFSKTKTNK